MRVSKHVTDIGPVQELYLRHTFPVGGGQSDDPFVDLGGPEPGWVVHDERSMWRGQAVVYPRSTLIHRYVRWYAPRAQGWRMKLSEVLYCDHMIPAKPLGWGPLRSKVADFDEPRLDMPIDGSEGRDPIGDIPVNSNVNNPGGQMVRPYQGKAPALYFVNGWMRTMDRHTAAWDEPGLEEMANVGKVKSERYGLLGRFNPDLSILPDGSRASVPAPLRGRPLDRWLGSCSNAGYDAAHYWRATHFIRAMLSWHGKGPWSEDIHALARDCSYWLSHLQAAPGGEGENPYWMLNDSLYYKSRRPVGPNGGRALGETSDTIAWAMLQGTREFDGWAGYFLSWVHDVAASNPWGCLQSAVAGNAQQSGWGGPRPDECGVHEKEHAMADIEVIKLLHGVCGVAYQLHGTDFADELPWLRRLIDQHATIYLDNTDARGRWDAPKYWITRDTSGAWLQTPKPNPGKGGKGFGSNEDQGLLYELALRFGSPAVSDRVREKRAMIEDGFTDNETWRAFWAGLVGALA